ncbi:putative MFS-type transporter YvmA [Siminovitchia terrae]|uniref:MFS-type transporter YvmA n=1 Tax=Siminovitchia terrae TaxID=1914933 RepID=A0ABQ4L1C3_SIMTE|nr:MFS transporter [Siminovitchia terrae]GIN98087.1 putative MFS-type transporter YvmA [Siminovitchia terrae]
MQRQISQIKVFVLYLLSISTFFASLNQNIYTPIIPLIRDSFNVSINWVNFTVSSFIFIIAMIQIALGTVIDTKNHKRLLLVSLILISISTLVCAYTTNFMLFMISRIVQAIGAGIIPLVTINMIAQLFEGKARGNAMGTYQILLTLAPAIAPILGGLLGQYYGYRGIFLFLFVIAAGLLILIAYVLPNDERKDDQRKTNSFIKNYIAVFSSYIGVSTMIVSFFVFFIYFAILVYLPILLNDHYHVSLQIIGLLYLPLTVSMILGSLLFKHLQKKISLNVLLIAVLFLMPLQVILFGLLHTKSIIGLSIILFGYGMTVGFSPPLFSTIISNEYSENRGTALGLFNFIRYAGMAIGGMLTGLYNVLPSAFVFFFLGIFLFFASILHYRSLKKSFL